MNNLRDKKILIIGAGISGLAAGVYARQYGYDTVILEKNPSVGGLCTGWYRKGRYIDGCVHWLTGTRKGSILNEMWKNVGAIESDSDVILLDSWGTYEYNGQKVTFWRDLDKAQKEWIELSPQDEKVIKKFFKMVRDFTKVELPMDKPMELQPFSKVMGVGLKILRVITSYVPTMFITPTQFANKFKSDAIRFALTHCLGGDWNLFSLIYSYATIVIGDGGVLKGGSKPMVERMKNRFLELGGELKLNSEVDKVLTNGRKAYGVRLKNESEIYADYIVSCMDPVFTLDKLLENKYQIPKFQKAFRDYKNNPSSSGVYVNMQIEGEYDIPIPYNFPVENFKVGDVDIDYLCLRSYAYDSESFTSNGKTMYSVLLDVKSEDYFYWKELRKNKIEYLEKKKEIANIVVNRIEEKIPDMKGKIEVLDVCTPMTFERYCNTSAGCYMGFDYTSKKLMFNHNGKVPGLDNFLLSGQWLQCSGGLPVALANGRFSIERIENKQNSLVLLKRMQTVK